MSLCITHCDQRKENCAGDVLTANDEKHMRSASFILHIRTFAPSSAASPFFTPFDPDLSLLFLLCDRLHTINVCHLLRVDNKKKKPSKNKTVGPS